MTNSQIIVMDMDDVLVDLSYEMYQRIRKNWRKYSIWFGDRGLLTSKQVSERFLYNISEWLIKKEYGADKEKYIKTMNMIFDEICKDVFNETLYDYLLPTEFAQKTLMNPNYIDNENISKVYILSRSITDGQKESKERFVKKYFNHPKIELIQVERKEDKGQALLNRGINWDLFVDDEIKNIISVFDAYKDRISGKNFLMPSMGYNEYFPKSIELEINSLGATLNYYDPYKNK